MWGKANIITRHVNQAYSTVQCMVGYHNYYLKKDINCTLLANCYRYIFIVF